MITLTNSITLEKNRLRHLGISSPTQSSQYVPKMGPKSEPKVMETEDAIEFVKKNNFQQALGETVIKIPHFVLRTSAFAFSKIIQREVQKTLKGG